MKLAKLHKLGAAAGAEEPGEELSHQRRLTWPTHPSQDVGKAQTSGQRIPNARLATRSALSLP